MSPDSEPPTPPNKRRSSKVWHPVSSGHDRSIAGSPVGGLETDERNLFNGPRADPRVARVLCILAALTVSLSGAASASAASSVVDVGRKRRRAAR